MTTVNERSNAMRARIIKNANEASLSLGGMVARLEAGEFLTSTLCREIFSYCRARILTLGEAMLLTELCTLANDLAAEELAHIEACAKLQTVGDFVPDFNVPALPIDKVLYAGRPMAPHTKLERRIVHNWLNFMAYHSWEVEHVHDGEYWTSVDDLMGDHPDLPKALAVMNLIFNLDDCKVQFGRNHEVRDVSHCVRLVLGNGIDLITDWSYSADDADGFNTVMEGFEPQDFE